MLSIIICSILPDLLEALKLNIQNSIGIEYEIIAVDNRKKKWPIAKVYNYAANRAKYPYLLFVHEDVRFHSLNWGEFIVPKLAEPDCGAIGFAGSKIKSVCYSGWYQFHESNVSYLYQGGTDRNSSFIVVNAFLEHPFEDVITLDGLGIFVRKELWEQYPFDEILLTDFHCYDIDFSLRIASAHYKNYVCCSNKLLIEHFSMGNFKTEGWLTTTIRLHDKWKALLPMKVDSFNCSLKQQLIFEECCSYNFLKTVLKSKCSRSDKKKVYKEFWKQPFTFNHLRNCLSASLKYIKYA